MTKHGDGWGLALALCGFVLLPLGDAVIKSIAGEWPATAVAALRFAIGASGLGAILAWREGRAGSVSRARAGKRCAGRRSRSPRSRSSHRCS